MGFNGLTLRARLTLWYLLVLAVPLVGFTVVADRVLSQILLGRTDYYIIDGLSAFGEGIQGELRERANATLAIMDAFHEVRFPQLRILMFNDDFVLVGSSNRNYLKQHVPVDSGRTPAMLSPEVAKEDSLDIAALIAQLRAQRASRGDGTTFEPLVDARSHFRINAQSMLLDGKRYVLLGAYPLDEVHAVLANVRRLYLFAVPLLLLAAALGGQLLASRGLAPLTTIVRRADDISEHSLHERLPVQNARDELGALALVFNRLLGRLEAAFGNQRRFMADASHELRTPLAVLQSEVEVTLANGTRSASDYHASALVMRDAARRLARIVEDLFLMSRADAGQLKIRRDPVDLEAVVDDAVSAARVVAAKNDITITLLPLIEAPVIGDSDLLGRLTLNLLDNAVKFSRPGQTVTVELSRSGDGFAIEVRDQGDGIPKEAQPHIFERFYRVNSERTREDESRTSGAGLGLAISKWIAHSHGGELVLVSSEAGRTVFRATIAANDPA